MGSDLILAGQRMANGLRVPPKCEAMTPRHAAHTPRNSWTSASKIYRRKRINECLDYRMRGFSFSRIAKEMRISVSTAHAYCVEGMDLVPLENGRQLLALELARLDALLNAHYATALTGDAIATGLCLRAIDQRSRLTGLYPEYGRVNVLVAAQHNGGMGTPTIEFIVPTGAPGGERVSPADMAAPPAPPFAWQRQIEPPKERYSTPFGTIELEADPPRPAGPRTELDPGAPRPQGGGGKLRLWGPAGKPHGWME